MGTGAEIALYAFFATSLAGTGLQIAGQQQQAKSAENIAEFNAKVQENAGIQADMEARENVARIRKNNERLKATQQTKIAKSNILFEGSPLDVLGATAAALELQAQDEARAGEAALRKSRTTATGTRFEGQSIAAGLRGRSIGTAISGFGKLIDTGIQSGGFG